MDAPWVHTCVSRFCTFQSHANLHGSDPVAVGAFFDPVTWNANVKLLASARRMERLMESSGVYALGDSRQPPAVPLRKLGDMITVSNMANTDAISFRQWVPPP
jgi:hypothetical protein